MLPILRSHSDATSVSKVADQMTRCATARRGDCKQTRHRHTCARAHTVFQTRLLPGPRNAHAQRALRIPRRDTAQRASTRPQARLELQPRGSAARNLRTGASYLDVTHHNHIQITHTRSTRFLYEIRAQWNLSVNVQHEGRLAAAEAGAAAATTTTAATAPSEHARLASHLQLSARALFRLRGSGSDLRCA